jgi:hypothetical protein
MSNAKKPVRKVQLVVDGSKEWPYVANAYDNQSGSITLFLDKGWSLVAPTGEVLTASADKPVKLIVKPARGARAGAAEPQA